MSNNNKELVLKATLVLLVVVFGVAGVMKLTPVLSPDFYDYWGSRFVQFSRVPPVGLLRLDPTVFRLIVAVTEIACAVGLVFGDTDQQRYVVFTLLGLMVGAIYTLLMLGAMRDAGGAVFMLIVVLLRLWAMGELPDVKVKTG